MSVLTSNIYPKSILCSEKKNDWEVLLGNGEVEHFEIDLSVKCRGCFAENQEMHDLFSVLDQNLTLADILMQITSFECREDDGGPPYLCTNCVTRVVDFFNFKLECHRTHGLIQSFLRGENVVLLDAPLKNDGSEMLNTKGDLEINDNCGINIIKDHSYNKCPSLTSISQNIGIDTLKTSNSYQHFASRQPKKRCWKCKRHILLKDFLSHRESHRTFSCPHCNKKFFHNSHMQFHRATVHSNERTFICELCGKGFKAKSLLKIHYVSHKNPRSHECHLCGEKFNFNGILKTHIRTKHIGSKEFVCAICNRAFTLKATLDKHILTHDKNRPRPFVCDLCPIAFREKDHLDRHHRFKHLKNFERPICEHCGRSFYSMNKLKSHIETIHRGNKDVDCGNVKY